MQLYTKSKPNRNCFKHFHSVYYLLNKKRIEYKSSLLICKTNYTLCVIMSLQIFMGILFVKPILLGFFLINTFSRAPLFIH